MNEFQLLHDFITVDEEVELLRHITRAPWDSTLSRRTQQYGYHYNYTNVRVDREPIAAIPQWLDSIAQRLVDRGIMATKPDQVIINEYNPGQGIGAHTDHRYAFGPVVCSLSLAAEVPMVFQKGRERVTIPLPRRSLAILKGDARYEWTHCIEARRSDAGVPRGRRISITFRTVL